MRRTFQTTLLCGSLAALLATGCADMQQMSPTARNTAIGRDTKGAAIGAGLGALGGYVWSRQMEQKKQAMERATVGTGVAVTQTPDNQLKLNIPSDISFDTGRADIKPNLRPVLDQFAQGLAQQPNTEVRIIGHTDSTGSDAINDPLSLRRAEAAREYLSARGVNPAQVLVAGRGSHEPVADNNSDTGRARNRRVEIFLGERQNVAAAPQPQPVPQPQQPGIQARPVR